MPGKCAEEDLVVYLAFTPIILLIYALRLIHRLDENSRNHIKVVENDSGMKHFPYEGDFQSQEILFWKFHAYL